MTDTKLARSPAVFHPEDATPSLKRSKTVFHPDFLKPAHQKTSPTVYATDFRHAIKEMERRKNPIHSPTP